ncbi:ATP-binding protein [Methanothermococcus okinawensis]|uniref:MCM family protein n=1 Tax=Methanothermococcus okinawensis (strain DSM 14208 / JCM 11175 / IH1) TaxID=647113 RepID=F8AKX9_METOI|nr:minichromosome maintenance protein MCM [Methanothermococcus okinawensis]AEH06281.1 MCM family protein [Methanothermococcus okinawensis IH1]
MSIADEIIDLLKKSQNHSMEWDNIYRLLCDAGYSKGGISTTKDRLIKRGVISEEIINNKKIITLLETPKEEKEEDDYALLTYKSQLIQFFKTAHSEDIRTDSELVEIDTSNLISSGLGAVVDMLIENPEKTLTLLSEAYKEAYYSFNNEDTDAVVTIKKLPTSTTIEDIRSNNLNKLVEFEGIIALASKLKTAIIEGKFYCPNCGNTFTIPIDPLNPVRELPCKCKEKAYLDEKGSKYVDFQELKVQQPIEQMKNPNDPPRYMTIINENAKGIYSGRVKVIGIPIKVASSKKLAVYDIIIKAINIIPIENTKKATISKEDEEDIKQLSKIPNVIDILSKNLFPEIEGHETIKKAIFLQQIRGTEKLIKRNVIHILLITDPGVGKSIMLQKIAKMPGNTYASVNTASGVGLTATVERVKTEIGDDTWVIKPGVIPKAHGGTACIDEFTTKSSIEHYLLEAMEHMKLSINKASISTVLPTNTSILAACNPKRGRYDPELTVWEQIQIGKALLSRFDLIFPLRDNANRYSDKKIAKRILRLNKQLVKKEDINGETIEIDGKRIKLTPDFIYKYIQYATNKIVLLSDEADNVIEDFYVELRQKTKDAGESITPRQLESAARLTEAIAKAKLKEIADGEDAREAVNIIMECYNEIAKDPETGLLDFAKIGGVPKSEVEKLDLIKDAIKHLEQTKDTPVSFYDLEELLSKKGISEEQLERYLEKLSNFGEVMEVRPGKYKVLS